MRDLVNLLEQAISFNYKAGNKVPEYDTLEYWRAVENQSTLMIEESTEGFDAANVHDAVESIDALCDELFVLAWRIEQHTKAGFDVVGALQQVIDNNSKKVFNSYYEACSAKEGLEVKHPDDEFFIETSVYNGLPFYTVRDSRNKIRKPVDFVAVELEEFIPEVYK